MPGRDADTPCQLVHRALVYRGEDELMAHLVAFAREGAVAGEQTFVVAPPRRLSALRSELGPDAPVGWISDHLASGSVGIAFDDVRRQVTARHRQGRVRLAADWAGLARRRDAERRAFMRWEAAATAMLSHADATVLCCHDGADPAMAAAARATHPEVWTDDGWAPDAAYRPPAEHLRDCEAPPPPPGAPLPLGDPWDLAPLRDRIARAGAATGVGRQALADFTIAANEVAANALWHGHGPRAALVGVADGALVCEVRDGGPGLDPLSAHAPPRDGAGSGLWIAHQLADVVQVIPDGGGTRVRLEVALPAAGPRAREARSGREGHLGGAP